MSFARLGSSFLGYIITGKNTMSFARLGASFLGYILTGKNTIITAEGTIRAGQDF